MSVNQYKIYCVTEAIYVYQWNVDIPTKCPNNSSHTITTVTQANPIDSNFFELWGTDVGQTKKAFSTQSRLLPIASNVSTQSFDLTFPISVCMLTVKFIVDTDNIGDYLECVLVPDTIIGKITSNVTAGDTSINTSQTVIDHIHKGYIVSLSDGTNTDILDQVLNIDVVNNKISCLYTPTHNFSASSPTYIRIGIKTMTNFILGKAGTYIVGAQTDGRIIPANSIFRLTYTNTSLTDKVFFCYFDYTF